jgi:hypothetical protein
VPAPGLGATSIYQRLPQTALIVQTPKTTFLSSYLFLRRFFSVGLLSLCGRAVWIDLFSFSFLRREKKPFVIFWPRQHR